MALSKFSRPTFENSTVMSFKRNMLRASASLDFPSIAGGAVADLTFTVANAEVGDDCVLSMVAAPQAGLVFRAWVSAADTVTVRAFNVTAGVIDAAAATYRVIVWKV